MSLTIFAIDPGSQNHGLAVVRFDGDDSETILLREIIDTAALEPRLACIAEQYTPDVTVIGSGTKCKNVAESAHSAGLSDIRLVDEKNTTVEARYRFLKENPSPWYLRLIPKSLRLPKEHCDDWAAVILAERTGRG